MKLCIANNMTYLETGTTITEKITGKLGPSDNASVFYCIVFGHGGS
jgi:hypothetical protein